MLNVNKTVSTRERQSLRLVVTRRLHATLLLRSDLAPALRPSRDPLNAKPCGQVCDWLLHGLCPHYRGPITNIQNKKIKRCDHNARQATSEREPDTSGHDGTETPPGECPHLTVQGSQWRDRITGVTVNRQA